MLDADYQDALANFNTIIDFVRFGVSKASMQDLHFGHGTDNAWDEIWMLVTGVLGLNYDVNPAVLNAKLTNAERELIVNKLQQRIEHNTPVPYLTHAAYFCGLEFYVDSRVLIPRSPLAELIQQQFAPWIAEEHVTRVLDLCTGSGCIAIACCMAFPEALVDAVDIDANALEVAKINQERHGLEQQLQLIQSDCYQSLTEQKYDIIVTNPPYVSQAEMQTLPAEYGHEPQHALECADDGLQIVKTIIHQAREHLNPGGILVVEVGNSEEALVDAYPDYPFLWLDFAHGGSGVFLLTYDQLLTL